ncbi:hypothetical protein [Halosquirtibacter xylanolyticus]
MTTNYQQEKDIQRISDDINPNTPEFYHNGEEITFNLYKDL